MHYHYLLFLTILIPPRMIIVAAAPPLINKSTCLNCGIPSKTFEITSIITAQITAIAIMLILKANFILPPKLILYAS